MTQNIGTLDRVIRIIFGLVLLSLTVVGPHTAWGYLGVIPIITALTGVCPLYRLIGVSTCAHPRGGNA